MQVNRNKQIRMIAIILLIVYLLGLAYFCFFAENYGRTIITDEYRYNLVPFKEIIRFYTYRESVGMMAFVLNIIGNVIVFMPFGLFMPMVFRWARGLFRMTGLTLLLSLVIELIQLVSRVGSFDVDDLILNTLGGFLGYLIFKILDVVRRRSVGA